MAIWQAESRESRVQNLVAKYRIVEGKAQANGMCWKQFRHGSNHRSLETLADSRYYYNKFISFTDDRGLHDDNPTCECGERGVRLNFLVACFGCA